MIVIAIVLLVIESFFLVYLLFSSVTMLFKINKLYVWRSYLIYDENWTFELTCFKNSGIKKLKDLKVVNKRLYFNNEKIGFINSSSCENFKKKYLNKSIKIDGILYLVKLDEQEKLSFEPF